MIDFSHIQTLIQEAEWHFEIPSGYQYAEAIEHEYEIEPVIYWLNKQSFGVYFLETFYNENKVEIEDYLRSLDDDDADEMTLDEMNHFFLKEYANTLGKSKIEQKKRAIQIPEWLEFTLLN